MAEGQGKHTPGPWMTGESMDRRIFGLGSPEHVYAEGGARMVADCCRGDRESGEANARLIAAAPDLLAACEQAAEYLRPWADLDRPTGPVAHDLVSWLDAAIAKARALAPAPAGGEGV